MHRFAVNPTLPPRQNGPESFRRVDRTLCVRSPSVMILRHYSALSEQSKQRETIFCRKGLVKTVIGR